MCAPHLRRCRCILFACQWCRSVPADGNRSSTKLEKLFILRRRGKHSVCLCELKRANEQQTGRVPLRVDAERHWNQGTIKLLVQAEGPEPRFVSQIFDCRALRHRQWGGMHREREKGFLCGQYMTDGPWFSWAIASVAASVVVVGGGGRVEGRKAARWWKDGESGEGQRGKKGAWKSVFIFLIICPPYGITGTPFY